MAKILGKQNPDVVRAERTSDGNVALVGYDIEDVGSESDGEILAYERNNKEATTLEQRKELRSLVRRNISEMRTALRDEEERRQRLYFAVQLAERGIAAAAHDLPKIDRDMLKRFTEALGAITSCYEESRLRANQFSRAIDELEADADKLTQLINELEREAAAL